MDIATIGIKVDSNGVVTATVQLDELAAAGATAEKATEKLSQTTKRASTALTAEAAAAREATQAQAAIAKALSSADAQRLALIQGLQKEIATYGMSKTEMQAYQGAILGISKTIDPLVGELNRLQAAHAATSASTREAAAQQVMASAAAAAAAREEAAVQSAITAALQSADSARHNLIEGLREQIATFGMSSTEIAQYQARILGVTASVEPLIARLNELKSAQQAQVAAQQAGATAAAREAETLAMIRASMESVDTARHSLIEGLREQIATFGMSSAELAQYRANLLQVSGAVDPLVAELKQLEAAQKEVNAATRAAADNKAFLASLETETALLGKTRSEIIAYQATQRGLSTETQQYVERLQAHEKAQARVIGGTQNLSRASQGLGKSQKEIDQAMRLLPAQITDIVTSLISGQPAYLVAIQQGGQLKDMFGGIAPAARALVGAISPFAAAAAAAAAGLGAFLLLSVKAESELSDLGASIIKTGNYSGTTAGQLLVMAGAVSDISGSRGQAIETLNAIVATGAVGAENLERLGLAGVQAQRNLGISTDQIAARFKALGESPTDASLKLNQAMHYLNAETIEQIANMEKVGQKTDAAALAQKAFADAIIGRGNEVEEQLGQYHRAWVRIGDAIARVYGGVESVFAGSSDEERLAALTSARGSRALGSTNSITGRNLNLGELNQAAADREEQQLRDRVAFLQKGADVEAETARRVSDGNAARERNNRLIEQSWTNQQKLNEAVKQYERDQATMKAGGFTTDSPEQRARTLANIRARYTEKEKPEGLSLSQELDLKVQEQFLDNQLAIEKEFYADSEKARADFVQEQNEIDASRAAFAEKLAAQAQDYQREIDSYGKGPKQRRYDQGVNQINDSTDRQGRQLDSQLARGSISQDMYDSEKEGLRRFHSDALGQWNTYFDAIEARQADFGAGMSEAFASYADSVKNVGEALGTTLTGAFDQAISSASELAAKNILWGEGGTESAKAIGRELLTSVVSGLIKAGAQYLVNEAIQLGSIGTTTVAGTAALTAQTAASVAAASATALAWAPAASAVSLASYGANAIPAAAGIASTYGLTESLSLLSGFKEGGYTGAYGLNQVAGVVHGQEYVVNATATQQHRGALEAMNSGNWDGGAKITINNNHSGAQVEARQMSDGEIVVMVREARAAAAQQAIATVHAQAGNPSSQFNARLRSANRGIAARGVS